MPTSRQLTGTHDQDCPRLSGTRTTSIYHMKLVSFLFEAFCGSHLESDVDRCSDARRNLVLPVPSSPLGGAGPHVSTLGAIGVAKGILTPSWMVIQRVPEL